MLSYALKCCVSVNSAWQLRYGWIKPQEPIEHEKALHFGLGFTASSCGR